MVQTKIVDGPLGRGQINAKGPMTSQQLAAVLMKERGMNTNDKHTVQLMVRRVGACLKHHRNKGVLRSVKGADGFMLWEAAT